MSRRRPRGVPSDVQILKQFLHVQKTSKRGPHQTFRYWTSFARPQTYKKSLRQTFRYWTSFARPQTYKTGPHQTFRYWTSFARPQTSKMGPFETFRYWTSFARPVDFQKWFWTDGRYTDMIWTSLWRHMFAGSEYMCTYYLNHILMFYIFKMKMKRGLCFIFWRKLKGSGVWQGVRGVLKSLKFSCIKFKALKSLKLYKKVLIMISRGLKFGDGKTRIAIWLNVTIKLQRLWFY